ncbi:Hsp70 family protein [Dactylosporangium sp. NPDC050588]|uniref:Hsp70 family protein n=1 Tax=Dactylosporangium sp. NPDC050588 TaxID=3157211 RepID=UPI0033E5AE1B
MPEPVAAATFLAQAQEVPVGAVVMVYDLGAGTCDATLLRRRADGFEPFASAGLNDLGGLDVDAAVVGFLQATYGTLWTDAATRRRLWDQVRAAKEMLSRASGTVIMVPALGREVPLGREQLEGLMRPVLRPSVAMVRSLLAEDGLRPSDLAGLFLVGGSSRIPLVATMLHEALGIAPVGAEQPELVVAEGALTVSLPAPATAATAAGAPTPEPRSDVGAAAGSASCNAVRLHDNGVVRATFVAEVRITPEDSTAAYDYKQRIAGDADLNLQPVQLTGLGEEAVIFEMRGSSAQAKTMLTLRIGVRDGNLVWQLRISVDRQDKAGWTAAQKQDLRDRLVTVTRAALPKVTAAVR